MELLGPAIAIDQLGMPAALAPHVLQDEQAHGGPLLKLLSCNIRDCQRLCIIARQ